MRPPKADAPRGTVVTVPSPVAEEAEWDSDMAVDACEETDPLLPVL